jgi:hypothetical protein
LPAAAEPLRLPTVLPGEKSKPGNVLTDLVGIVDDPEKANGPVKSPNCRDDHRYGGIKTIGG